MEVEAKNPILYVCNQEFKIKGSKILDEHERAETNTRKKDTKRSKVQYGVPVHTKHNFNK